MKIENIKRIYVGIEEIKRLVAREIEKQQCMETGSIDSQLLGEGNMSELGGFCLQYVEINGKVA